VSLKTCQADASVLETEMATREAIRLFVELRNTEFRRLA